MSEQTKTVQLVAVERGFMNGRLIEPGTSFSFTGAKAPKWAKPKEEARAALAAKASKVKAFDTKPKDAQSAMKQKAAEFTGSGESLA